MLTVELRTIDLERVVELWENDKETLIDELINDYEMLKTEYRKLVKKHTQDSHKAIILRQGFYSKNRINYEKELGLSEKIYGTIKFTKDLTENIKISRKLIESNILNNSSNEAFAIKEIVRLKAREIEDMLLKLNVKVKYEKDFHSNSDLWLHDDLNELIELKGFEEENILE